MRESKGAFVEALEWTIEQNMKEKQKIIQYCIDNNIPLSGKDVAEILFGDFQMFANKLNYYLNGD